MQNPPIYLANPDDLVSLPDIYFQVKKLVQSGAGTSELANTISLDPALTVRFLSIANSALFAPRTEISTVSRAITLLGTQLVHDIVLASSVSDLFEGIPRELVDVHTFWTQSVSCGVLANAIAGHLDLLDAGHVFIEGLLADIGHVVMYQYETEKMQKILQAARNTGEPIHEIELRELGYDYTDVGGYLTRVWDLPNGIWQVLMHHQNPTAADEYQLETAIVHVARRCSEAMNTAQESPAIEPSALEALNLTAEELIELCDQSRETIAATVATFSVVMKAA